MQKYLSRKFLLGIVLMISIVALQIFDKLSQELLYGLIGIYSIYVTGNVYQKKVSDNTDETEGI